MPAPLRSSDQTPIGALAAVARRSGPRRVVLVLAVFVAGCASGDVELDIVDPVISDAGATAAVYLRVVNRGDAADELLSVSVEGSSHTMLHATQLDDSGVVTMGPSGPLRIAPGEELVLEAGGLHAMVMDPPSMDRGDTVALILIFEEAGEIEVAARVVDPAEAADPDAEGS